MFRVLMDLRVVEAASFIAAPSCGLHLAQLGAEVIRIDAIGGGPDYGRWPRSPEGRSLYWEGLNKGKKSVALDLSRPEGRELAASLIAAPGEGGGLFVTNYPAGGFLAHAKLAARRADLITVRVAGWADGTSAVDYTVNSAVGIPAMTGPAELGDEPVNHVLPAWDLYAGSQAAFSLLAAERSRLRTGKGGEITIPLGELAIATMGNLGQIAEVSISGADRPRLGNDLFGAFGRDFATRDGRRVMIVAITRHQWKALVQTLALGERVAELERELGVSFDADEGLRFEHRGRLNPLVETEVAARTLEEIARLFGGTGVCWGPYQTLKQALESDPRFSAKNPLLCEIEHPGGRYLTPGAASEFHGLERQAGARAPRLGEHTDEVLAGVLALPDHVIARLHETGLAAGADDK
jgi:2-methylfumaryl-CoA isomerase